MSDNKSTEHIDALLQNLSDRKNDPDYQAHRARWRAVHDADADAFFKQAFGVFVAIAVVLALIWGEEMTSFLNLLFGINGWAALALIIAVVGVSLRKATRSSYN